MGVVALATTVVSSDEFASAVLDSLDAVALFVSASTSASRALS